MLLAKNIVTVTASDTNVSVSTGTDIHGAILNTNCQDCNGKLFANSDAAWQAAFEHGHIIPYVSRRTGTRFTGEAWYLDPVRNASRQIYRLKSLMTK